MNRRLTFTAASILLAALLPVATHAQIGDLIKSATQGGSQGAADGIGGLGNLGGIAGGGGTPSLQALTSGSTGNVAGVLEFCVKNNYLGGASGAASVKDKLLGQLGGASASDPGYADGSRGILTGADGSKFDLSGDGLKKQLTRQACDKILSQGKSLL